MSAAIPRRCDLVYRALSGLCGGTEYTAQTGWWRYIDIIRVTGRNSSERKLRELIEACPGLVQDRVESADGNQFKVFRLAPKAEADEGLEFQVKIPKTPGQLFDLPPLGRPE